MIQKIKKPVSILLTVLMVFSVFAIVPITASAAIGDFVPESEYLTFTAEEAGSSVTLNVYSGSNLQYNKNNSGWQSYTAGTQIALASAGDSVRFRGKNTTFNASNHVSIGGKVACSGNVMSLRLDDNGEVQGLCDRCFSNMFKDCTGLTAAPKLPETTLAVRCYERMFYGCESLATAPELPATMLARYCYSSMFYGCESLTTAPELPATMLESNCYSSMFSGCSSLTTAPELWATTLAESCYYCMFYGCTSLTTAPELPATTLAGYCYQGMFNDCTSLTTAPELPATTLAESCYYNMFSGCRSLTTAPELPATTLESECYSSMFYGCRSLTTAPELPATTLESFCYDSMFSGCSSIKLSETQTAEYSIPYSVPSHGNGTTALYALNSMFAGTGGTFTGTPEINKTYYLYREVPKYTVTWKNGDTTLETDTDVAEGTTPTYDGATPTKDGVTFAGWTDSHGVFYAKDATLPEVTADETYTAVFELTIGSVDEWNSFAASVKGGNTYSGVIVRMTADVGPVTTMVDGTFSGTFDGDGHTLTVNISGGSTSAATFAYVKDATIQNLRLEGTVTSSGIHTAALVKSVSGTGSTCTIKNVDIYADVNCSQGYIGGFIGHAGTANTVNIENSIFAGSINKTGSNQGFIGAFIGWSQTLTATINNCAFTGSYNNIKSFNNIGFSYNAPTKVTVSGFYSSASEVFVANVNHGTRLYVPSSSYPTTVALVENGDEKTFYSAFSDALAAWTDDSTLALLANVERNSTINVTGKQTLDLNGYGIKMTAVNTTLFEVSGNLTLNDSDTTKIHKFDPPSGTAGLATLNEESGSLEIHGGYITGFKGAIDRYVIHTQNGGSFTMNGGNLIGNEGTASGSNCAVVIGASGDVTMNGGAIIYNKSGYWGAAINAGNCLVKITGGTIAHNYSAENTAAIFCWNLEMSGGSVTDNVAAKTGQSAGITAYYHATFSGNPVIKDNTDSTGASNLNVYSNPQCSTILSNLGENACIGITMNNPGVFTDSSDTSFNDPTKFFSDKSNYIVGKNAAGQLLLGVPRNVTWNMDDGSTIDTTKVAHGGVPTHANPTKPADDTNTYTFSGWKNGTNTYSTTDALPEVTGDTTYTAQFTAKPKKLIAGHTLSLDGNIGINFYLDPTVAGLTPNQVTKSNLKYSFEWANGNALVDVKAQAEEQEFSIVNKDDVDYIKVTCHVCAAEMTCGVKASFTIGDKTEIETYSVRQYADEILSDSNSSDELKNLTKAMLNYGAKAQTKFGIKSEDPKDLADYKVDYTMGNVTDTMIDEAVKKENGRVTGTDLKAVASAHGAKWYTTSLVYLDDNTLRHYFVKDTEDFQPSDYTANKGNYYYVEVSGIQAKNLDKWQTFKVGNEEFKYSALDFAKLMIYSNSDDASKNLAKALYWYNQAANDYFVD